MYSALRFVYWCGVRLCFIWKLPVSPTECSGWSVHSGILEVPSVLWSDSSKLGGHLHPKCKQPKNLFLQLSLFLMDIKCSQDAVWTAGTFFSCVHNFIPKQVWTLYGFCWWWLAPSHCLRCAFAEVLPKAYETQSPVHHQFFSSLPP